MRRLVALLGAVLLVASMAAVSPASAASATQWHRLNPFAPTGEHERLICVSGSVERCLYDKLPQPSLGFNWDRTKGVFAGTENGAWVCPAWFPEFVCDSVMDVVTGSATYFPQGGAPFTVGEDLITLDLGGPPVLLVYWHDQFACPWFGTFAEALAANPDGEPDCIFP
jgi:hypothetical protein